MTGDDAKIKNRLMLYRVCDGFNSASGSMRVTQFLYFGFAGMIKPAAADVFDDLPNLIAVQPDAMGRADVDDDSRSTGIVHTVHHIRAARAFEINHVRVQRHRRRQAQAGGRLLPLGGGTDMLEIRDIHPQSAAAGAFIQRRIGDFHIDQRGVTARAREFGIVSFVDRRRPRTTVRAVLRAREHHPHALGTRDGL